MSYLHGKGIVALHLERREAKILGQLQEFIDQLDGFRSGTWSGELTGFQNLCKEEHC